MKPFIERLADCIIRQEGPTQNNNPGNLWDDFDPPRKCARIWPHIPIDERGLLIFPSPGAGRAALIHDLRVKISAHKYSLAEAIEVYAPRADARNDTDAYIRNVAHWMGIPAYGVELEVLERLEEQKEVRFEQQNKETA